MVKKLLPYLILIIFSGCASQPVDSPIGIPARPLLIPIPIEMQVRIPIDALDIIAINDAELKSHILRLEGRIRLHDEGLE